MCFSILNKIKLCNRKSKELSLHNIWILKWYDDIKDSYLVGEVLMLQSPGTCLGMENQIFLLLQRDNCFDKLFH